MLLTSLARRLRIGWATPLACTLVSLAILLGLLGCQGTVETHETSPAEPIATGAVHHAYDADLRLGCECLNGECTFANGTCAGAGVGQVAFGYDADGLLTSAGELVLTRDLANELLTRAAVGTVYESFETSTYGELTSLVAKKDDPPGVARDTLGRKRAGARGNGADARDTLADFPGRGPEQPAGLGAPSAPTVSSLRSRAGTTARTWLSCPS